MVVAQVTLWITAIVVVCMAEGEWEGRGRRPDAAGVLSAHLRLTRGFSSDQSGVVQLEALELWMLAGRLPLAGVGGSRVKGLLASAVLAVCGMAASESSLLLRAS